MFASARKTFASPPLLIVATLIASPHAACADLWDPDAPTCRVETVAPPAVAVAWDDPPLDSVEQSLRSLVVLPTAPTRLTRTPAISIGGVEGAATEGFIVAAVDLLDARGEPVETTETCATTADASRCRDVHASFTRGPTPGDRLRVHLTWTDGGAPSGCLTPSEPTATEIVSLPADPRPTSFVPAVSAHQTPDGTLWLGYLDFGLIGITSGGDVARYPAVPSTTPWSPAHTTAQTPYLFAVEDAGGGALWIGGATTGVSWFDPGPDPLDPADDRWAHAHPSPRYADDPLAELAETTMAIHADPDGALWVASLSGVHRLAADAPGLDLETLAPGAYFAITADAAGTVWAGRTVDPAVVAAWDDAGGDRWPDAALISLTAPEAGPPQVTPHDVGVEVVTALAVLGDTLFIGTPSGLHARPLAGPDAATAAIATDRLSGLVITALAPVEGGLWVAARDECAVDVGRLVRLDVPAGAPPTVAQDVSDAGFGTRDFNAVEVLGDGRLFVSTLVPTLAEAVVGPLSASGCAPPAGTDYGEADAFTFDPRSGDAPAPVGAR